jgi:hypothetical protein
MLLIGKKRDKGFFLLELILGIGLVSFGLLSALGSFARGIAAKNASEDYFKAGILLEENIYLVYNTDKTERIREGIFQAYNGDFSWRISIRKIEKNSLSEAIFDVFSSHGRHDVKLTAVTYL